MNLKITFRVTFILLLFTASLVSSFSSFAQTNYEDVVYLKNGSVIHGMIIEQVPNESLTIKTADRNIFVFKIEEIEKITKEEVMPLKPEYVPVPENQGIIIPEKIVVPEKNYGKGYVNILEFTFGREMLQNHSNQAMTGSVGSFSQFSIGIQDINGYRFNSHFSAGIGFGFHLYPGLVYMPLFADFRFHIQKKGISPYLGFAIGYTFTQMEILGFESSKDYYGGMMVNPAFGVKFPIKRRFAFIMSFGYRYQEARIYTHNAIWQSSNSYGSDYYQGYTLGYLNTKVGFEF
jgi:hypothetical protein